MTEDGAIATGLDAASIVAELAAAGHPLPPGHRLATLAEEPGLRRPVNTHNVAAWPTFMLQGEVSDRLWDHLFSDFAPFQVALLAPDGSVAAAGNSAPLAWDGTEADLPEGWDDQFERTVAGHEAAVAPTTLGALQIVVGSGRQGAGLSRLMVEAFRAAGRLSGFRALIACVRPTAKSRYPLMPIETYASWLRSDGLPYDPWLRVHVRAGGRIARAAPRSMWIAGSIAEWRDWTGLEFPVSGPYLVPGATNPVEVDVESGRVEYWDANVWVVHELEETDRT